MSNLYITNDDYGNTGLAIFMGEGVFFCFLNFLDDKKPTMGSGESQLGKSE